MTLAVVYETRKRRRWVAYGAQQNTPYYVRIARLQPPRMRNVDFNSRNEKPRSWVPLEATLTPRGKVHCARSAFSRQDVNLQWQMHRLEKQKIVGGAFV